MKMKKGQEEMIGLAVIIVLVAVVLLIFLGLSLGRNKSQNIETSETDNFVQAMLQYTTQCQDNFGYVTVKNLIFSCITNPNSVQCPGSSNACQTLNSTLNGIMGSSWNVGNESSIKGYALNVSSDTGYLVTLKAGNSTATSQGASEDLSKGGTAAHIILRVYS